MKASEQTLALRCAVATSRTVGAHLRRALNQTKRINSQVQHDIKLELDVRSQQQIERALRRSFPHVVVLGEEGNTGDQQAPHRWVIDPIDGTVNFTYGIPHACISIALQERIEGSSSGKSQPAYRTLVGVVYDPFCDELWTAIRGQRARLNGRPIQVSQRSKLSEAIVSMGFSKSSTTLNEMLPVFNRLVHRVRKIRIMGAAALATVYVASGRFDAYVEGGVRLWDIAAGGLIVECAGGEFWHRAAPGEHVYEIRINNGRLRGQLEKLL